MKKIKKITWLVIVMAITMVLGTIQFGYALDKENIYTRVWANDVVANSARTKGISDSASNYRYILNNSLGAPAAMDYYDVNGAVDNSKVTSMRYYESLTYKFGDNDESVTIYNNPDSDKADLVLAEVTVGGWHPEAIEIYLVDAVVDGQMQQEPYFIGVAFNNVGIMLKDLGLLSDRGVDGFAQTAIVSGNYTMTNVWFPENVESAQAVILKDVTAGYNQEPYVYNGKTSFTINGIMYKWTTWTDKKDGFDLDAVGAWDIEVVYSGEISVMTFKDITGDGLWDPHPSVNQTPLAGINFMLLKWDDAANDFVFDRAAVSDENGLVAFGKCGEGTYKVVEAFNAGFTQTSFLDGVYVVVNRANDNALYYTDSSLSRVITSLPEFGNQPDYVHSTSAGLVESAGLWRNSKDTVNGVFRMNSLPQCNPNNWFMGIEFSGGDKKVDYVAGIQYNVGDVEISENEDGTVTVSVTIDTTIARNDGEIYVQMYTSKSDMQDMGSSEVIIIDENGIGSYTFDNFVAGQTYYFYIHGAVWALNSNFYSHVQP